MVESAGLVNNTVLRVIRRCVQAHSPTHKLSGLHQQPQIAGVLRYVHIQMVWNLVIQGAFRFLILVVMVVDHKIRHGALTESEMSSVLMGTL